MSKVVTPKSDPDVHPIDHPQSDKDVGSKYVGDEKSETQQLIELIKQQKDDSDARFKYWKMRLLWFSIIGIIIYVYYFEYPYLKWYFGY